MRLACAALIGSVIATAVSAADETSLAALRATVRLHGGGQSSTAFAVLVPEDGANPRMLLVTAAHSFEKMKGDSATAVLRAPAKEGRFERRDAPVTIRAGGKPLWVRHPTADVAVLEWSPPAGVDLAAFPLASLATVADFDAGRVGVGQRVRVACFPAQTEANEAGWPILRTGAIATHPLTPAAALEKLFVDYSHFGGDSGAAVVVDGGKEPLVVAVVVAMQRQTDRVESPFEEKTVYMPLGLAVSVPAPLLLQTIDRWRAEPEDARAADDGTKANAP